MELVEVSKKLRREVKKAGIELEKLIKPINTRLRTERGAVTGGVKEKRAVNEKGLNDVLTEVKNTNNYTVGEVTTEKDLSTVTLTATPEYLKSKSTLLFNVVMNKGKIVLESISFVSGEEVQLNVTLKDVKESLKAIKAE